MVPDNLVGVSQTRNYQPSGRVRDATQRGMKKGPPRLLGAAPS
jgi:hypothetical protein